MSSDEPAVSYEMNQRGVNKAILTKVGHKQHPLAPKIDKRLENVDWLSNRNYFD